MKTIFTLLVALAFYNYSNAQGSMYGTLDLGGSKGQGAIYKTDSNGRNYQVIHNFEIDESIYTTAKQKLIEINGKMYGIGKSLEDTGVIIFSYNLNTKRYTEEFRGSSDLGTNPLSSICKTTGGKYFFTTSRGGEFNAGTMVEYNPTNNTTTKKLDFANEISGTFANADLTEGANGDLYGVAMMGGANSDGSIFRYSVSGDSLEEVASFASATTGRIPQSTLLRANNGLFYSFTSRGGTNDRGTFYSFNPITKTITTIVDFDMTNGGGAGNNSLIQTSNGKIYGITGVNIIHEYTISTNTWVNKYTIPSNSYADRPQTGFHELPNGNLLLVSTFGRHNGGSNQGAVVEYNPTTNSTSLIAAMSDNEAGNRPQATLSLGSNGKYYFLSSAGAKGTRGAIAELDYSSKTLVAAHDFAESVEGRRPYRGLTMGTNGLLYGLTYQGGNGAGVIFSINPQTDAFKVEQELSKDQGTAAVTQLIEAAPNVFYFCTSGGGLSGRGTTVKWNAVTKTETTVGNFVNLGSYSASANLTKGIDGNIYGVCNSGGDYQNGVLFKIDTQIDSLTAIASYRNSGPSQPQAKLTALPNGNFLSTTFRGGVNNEGTIYEYNAAMDSLVILVNLTDSTGKGGQSGFTKANNGKYYTYFTSVSNNNLFPGGTLIEYDYDAKKMEIKGGNKVAPSGRYTSSYSDFLLATNGNFYGIIPGSNRNSPSWIAEYNVDNDSLTFVKSTDEGISGLTQAMPASQNTHNPLLSSIKSLLIYPNPSSDKVKIELDQTEIKSSIIIDLTGKTHTPIWRGNELSVAHLPHGLYILKIRTNKNQLYTAKMMVE